MNKEDIKRTRELAAEILALTYSKNTDDIPQDSYKYLLESIEKKRYGYYLVTNSEIEMLKKDYEETREQLLDDDGRGSVINELTLVMKTIGCRVRGDEEFNKEAVIKQLDDIIEESLKSVKEKNVPYYIISRGCWLVETDVVLGEINIVFSLFNTNEFRD